MARRGQRIVLHGPVVERRRTLKSGKTKSKYTMEIRSTPILHDFDEMRMAKPVAQAIRDDIEDSIKKIPRSVAPATVDRRQRDLDPGSRGNKSWRERYLGVRTKKGTLHKLSFDSEPKAENLHKWGYFSGRLAEGVVATQSTSEQAFIINVTKNRLDPSLFGPGYGTFIDILSAHVPGLTNPADLLKSRRVREEINLSINDLITSAEQRAADKLRKLRQKRSQLLRGLTRGFVRSIL